MVPRNHFMHQGHALLQNFDTKEYLCGGCKTDGDGINFGCEPCSFHMHDFCSNCPMILSSFLHPEHPLYLMISNTACPRICDVCEDTVEGLFYWCQTCNFNVHPLCTQFPQSLYHAVHYLHRLMFQKSYKDAPCCVCGDVCNPWRYRCGCCDGFDIHLECVEKSYETTTRRMPPHAGLYTYGGVNSTANSYNIYKPPPPPYDMNQYHPYGGVPMYNINGIAPPGTYAHQPNNFPPGTYAHQPNNFHGEMPVGTYHNYGTPPNINSHNVYNPFNYGLPCNTNMCSTYTYYNAHNGAPFDSNSQHLQFHHGNTSHQAPPHVAQTNPTQGQGFGKLGKKIFRIVSSLTVGVLSNVIFGAIFDPTN